MTPDLADCLRAWGITGRPTITVSQGGTNNQTVFVRTADRQFVLRIYQNQSEGRIRAEHALLQALSTLDLPFAIPAPLWTASGDTIASTQSGWASLAPFIRGGFPVIDDVAHQRAMGAALARLDLALAGLPGELAPAHWNLDLDFVHPAVPEVAELAADLSARLPGLGSWLATAIPEVGGATARIGAVPRQIVHGDWGAGNLLQQDGVVTGVLDFEVAGTDLAINDLAAAILQCIHDVWAPAGRGLLEALLEGYCAVRRADDGEIRALPALLRHRALASVVWRAGRWRLDLADLDEVSLRIAAARRLFEWLCHKGSEIVEIGLSIRDAASR